LEKEGDRKEKTRKKRDLKMIRGHSKGMRAEKESIGLACYFRITSAAPAYREHYRRIIR